MDIHCPLLKKYNERSDTNVFAIRRISKQFRTNEKNIKRNGGFTLTSQVQS